MVISNGISQMIDSHKTAGVKLHDKKFAKFRFLGPNTFFTISPRGKSITYYHQYIEN